MASASATLVVDDSDLQESLAMQTDASTDAVPVLAEFTAEELELFLMATTTTTTSVLQGVPASSSSSTSSVKSEPEDEPLSAAAKRMRRTEIERLSRRRRQASLRAKRDEVKTLEAKFATLLAGHAVARARADGWQRRLMDEMDDALVSTSVKDEDTKFADTLRQLRDKFIDLKLLERELETEQKNLNRMLRGRELLSMSIQSIALTLLRDWTPVEADASNSTIVEAMDFVPATPEQYATYLRDAYAELMALEASLQFTTSGNTCMGWSDRQFEDSDKVVYSMTKSFENREPRALLDESWAVFADEARMRQSFGAWGATMALRVLDRPSEDLMVLYRTNTRRQCQNKRFHIVYLLFRVRTENGFTLCMRSVRALETPLKGPGKWTGIFTWLHFRETGDGCEVEYNNYFPAKKVQRFSHAHMLIAFISTVVRWESSCVTPRLLVEST